MDNTITTPIIKQKKTADKKAYFKKYYTDHSEKYKVYNEKRKHLTETCSTCGATLAIKHMKRHLLTKKHLAHVKQPTIDDAKTE